ncbi:MAG: ATP-grasp domain-containing protein [Sphaerobacteraceae bacterium]|nr:MAG: ATP-grasp domain-containing protein [Sphaerobacteraceae bacterium]
MSSNDQKRVLMLLSPQSYRNAAFLKAGERLGLDVIQVVDVPEALASEWGINNGVEFRKPEQAEQKLMDRLGSDPVNAVISLDDSATLLASKVAHRLNLPSNDPEAALAARDKWVMRQRLHDHGVPAPMAWRHDLDADPATIAVDVRYPCVVKPNLLSGSRGVIRANDPDEFTKAFERTRQILVSEGFTNETAGILVEDYLPGIEVALEGILTEGKLQVLALFDKPDPLEGPFFEETIYTTPSRLSDEEQQAIATCTEEASAALGLRTGPVHAELRLNDMGPWIIEIAGRSIGGLCSTILEFGTGQSLEELILRHAIGEPISGAERGDDAVGVMMIPIPKAGILREVCGVEEAKQVPGVTGVEISAPINHSIVPLPEGSSYLGFIFAKGDNVDDVEAALRTAHNALEFRISSQIRLTADPVSPPSR